MNDERLILTKIAQFMCTEKWWQPLVSFMYHNCSNFNENIYSFENYNFFIQFRDLVESIIDKDMCESIKVTPDVFEQVLNAATKRYDLQGLVIIDLLRKATDFQEFHAQMVSMNKKIEIDVANLIAQYSDQLSQPGIDTEKVAVYFSKILAKHESENLNEMIEKNCDVTRKLLKLNPRKKNIRRANTYVPKNQKSVKLKPKFFTTNEEIPEIPPELTKTVPESKSVQIPNNSNLLWNTVDLSVETNKKPEEDNKMKAEIAKRKAFYREQRDKMRRIELTKDLEKSQLPPLLRHRTTPRIYRVKK